MVKPDELLTKSKFYGIIIELMFKSDGLSKPKTAMLH